MSDSRHSDTQEDWIPPAHRVGGNCREHGLALAPLPSPPPQHLRSDRNCPFDFAPPWSLPTLQLPAPCRTKSPQGPTCSIMSVTWPPFRPSPCVVRLLPAAPKLLPCCDLEVTTDNVSPLPTGGRVGDAQAGEGRPGEPAREDGRQSCGDQEIAPGQSRRQALR